MQPTQIWFPFKTSPLPGDDVTESRAGEPHLTVICQASGSGGARQGSRVGSPRSRLFTSTPGRQPGTLRLSNKERARASLGEGLPPPHRSPKGTLPNLGSNGFLFFLFFFFFFCPLGCPQPESQDHLNWRGSRAGGVWSDGVYLIQQETYRFLKQPPPEPPELCGHSPRLCAQPQNRGVCARSFVKEKKRKHFSM